MKFNESLVPESQHQKIIHIKLETKMTKCFNSLFSSSPSKTTIIVPLHLHPPSVPPGMNILHTENIRFNKYNSHPQPSSCPPPYHGEPIPCTPRRPQVQIQRSTNTITPQQYEPRRRQLQDELVQFWNPWVQLQPHPRRSQLCGLLPESTLQWSGSSEGRLPIGQVKQLNLIKLN